jgi:hypothetical protein
MMADNDDRNAVDLASAYLDGEATADERARVEGDAVLMAEVARLRQVRDAVATIPPAPAEAREAAIAAAMAAFDELPVEPPDTEQPAAPSNVTSLERRRQVRTMQAVTAAAAAAVVLVIGGFVIANRGGGDDESTAVEVQSAEVPAVIERGDSTATESSALIPAAAPTTTTAAVSEPDDVAASAALNETMAAPIATQASESEFDAAEAPAAATEAPPVLHDAEDLRTIAEGLPDDPPAVDDVVAQCEQRQPQSIPDAVYEDAEGNDTDVALATTADGYAAISLDDCTIVLRSST